MIGVASLTIAGVAVLCPAGSAGQGLDIWWTIDHRRWEPRRPSIRGDWLAVSLKAPIDQQDCESDRSSHKEEPLQERFLGQTVKDDSCIVLNVVEREFKTHRFDSDQE